MINIPQLPTKFCKDGIYFKPDARWLNKENRIRYGLCTHYFATNTDPITGDPVYREANLERMFGTCCLEAKNYERRLDTMSAISDMNDDNDWKDNAVLFVCILVCIFIIIRK